MSKTPKLKNNSNVANAQALEGQKLFVPLLSILLIMVFAIFVWQIIVVAGEYQEALQLGDEELIRTTHRDIILLPIVTVVFVAGMIGFICWIDKKVKQNQKKFALLNDVKEEAWEENKKHFI